MRLGPYGVLYWASAVGAEGVGVSGPGLGFGIFRALGP